MLGSHVSRLEWRSHQTVRGGDVDDAPEATRFHARNHGLGEMKDRGQVEGNDCVPALGGKLFQRGDKLNASIVDQDVDLAALRRHPFDHCRGLFRVRQIRAVIGDLTSGFLL